MNKSKKYLITAIALLIIAIIYTFLVSKVDLKPIGPEGSFVGFGTINEIVHNYIGVHMSFYYLTNVLGYIALLAVVFFVIIAMVQTAKKNFNKRLIPLGIFYILLGLVYLLFEVLIINKRPVLIDGVLEASYPSSHTMLGIGVCLSFSYLIKYFVNNKTTVKALKFLSIVLACAIVFGRMLSGVHWATDIIIVSSLLFFLFAGVSFVEEKENVEDIKQG